MLARLISPQDLPEEIALGAKLIDATWGIPGTEDQIAKGILNGALFFDLSKTKAVPVAERTPKLIAQLLGEIGLSPTDDLVIYDRRGVFSAPRFWWLLGRVGHENVSILNGGSTGAIASGIRTNSIHEALPKTTYQLRSPLCHEATIEDILARKAQIVDARSAGRFYATEPEPRPGLRGGHMPGAISLPYSGLLNGGFIRPDTELAEAAGMAGIDLSKPIITTCGSGVTAAGLAFIFTRLGANDVRVYTGSWTEYGVSGAPVETI